jgi:hypothetical protein
MKDFVKILFVVFAFSMLVFSCKKEETYSEIPEIKFKSISVEDSIDYLNVTKKVSIVFSIIDGDGDIGIQVDENDTTSLQYYDLFVKLFEIKNGKTNEITDTISNKRMPYVGDITQGEVLKADVQFNVYYLKSALDSIFYEISVQDRALNKSNSIRTSVISLKN